MCGERCAALRRNLSVDEPEVVSAAVELEAAFSKSQHRSRGAEGDRAIGLGDDQFLNDFVIRAGYGHGQRVGLHADPEFPHLDILRFSEFANLELRVDLLLDECC